MSTQFRPVEIPPGVVATATKKMRSSNWAEVNLMRWREGQLMPVGGQAQMPPGGPGYVFASRCKAIHSWYGQDQVLHIAYLCEANLYVDTGGALTDISPSPPLTAPGPISLGGYGARLYGTGVYGKPRVISLLQMLDKMPSAYSLDNFGSILYAMTSADGRLLMWDPAAGTAGNVASLAAASAILTTSPNITMPANSGSVTPGMSVYNTTSNTPVGTVLTYVGTALVLTANALNAGATGNVLAFGNVAVVQPAAAGRGPVPHGRCFVVTQERFIIIFGSTQDGTGGTNGSFRRFAWCDQENPGAWDYSSVTSQAGFLDLEPASPIVAAFSSRTGVLFWTGKKAYRSRFLGLPYVYNYEELADNCTPWSPQSVATTSSLMVWMSEQGAFSFDGTSILPVQCMVRPWVDDDVDIVNVREQACAVHVENFNEVWWFFPQLGQPYNTRAIIYSYKEGWWSMARMSRSAGIAGAYNVHTIMANGTVAYQHEAGAQPHSADAAQPFAETFDLNIASGGRLTTVKQLIPDVEGAIANLRYSIFYRNSRSLGLAEQQSPLTPVRPDGYVDFRVTGRDVRLRIDVAPGNVQNFTLGQHLVDSVPRGDR